MKKVSSVLYMDYFYTCVQCTCMVLLCTTYMYWQIGRLYMYTNAVCRLAISFTLYITCRYRAFTNRRHSRLLHHLQVLAKAGGAADKPPKCQKRRQRLIRQAKWDRPTQLSTADNSSQLCPQQAIRPCVFAFSRPFFSDDLVVSKKLFFSHRYYQARNKAYRKLKKINGMAYIYTYLLACIT